jgi:hypothetical protein
VTLPGVYYYGSVASGSTEHQYLAPGTYILGDASIAVLGFPLPSLLGHATSATGESAALR